MYVPTGINLAQNTEAPLLGLLVAPITALVGPIAAANLVMVLAMPVSACAAFYVFRRWEVWRPAAALGGLLYGFSPYMMGQGLGHPVLVFAPWPPLIALVLSRIVAERGRPGIRGLQLGFLLVAQFLTEPELLAMLGIVGFVGLAAVVLRHPAGPRVVLGRLARPLCIGGILAAVLLSYPIWMITAGPEHYSSPAQGITNPYVNDLWSFVAPGPMQRVTYGLGGLGNRVVAGNPFESGGFVGVALLAAAGVLAWRSRRRGRTQVALVCGLTAAAPLPRPVPDRRRSSHPDPAALPTGEPSPTSRQRARGSVLGVHRRRASRRSWRSVSTISAVRVWRANVRAPPGSNAGSAASAALWLAGVTVVAGLTWWPRWPVPSQSVSTLPDRIRSSIPPSDPVAITYPYADSHDPTALGWQVTDDFAFRLLGGRGEHPERVDGFLLFPARMHPDGSAALSLRLRRASGSTALPLPTTLPSWPPPVAPLPPTASVS